MILTWQIELTDDAAKQLKKLDRREAKQITDYLRKRVEVLDDPRQLGKSLKGQFASLWRYRIGNYRVICELQDSEFIVLVVGLGHRKEIYHH